MVTAAAFPAASSGEIGLDAAGKVCDVMADF